VIRSAAIMTAKTEANRLILMVNMGLAFREL